MEHAETLSPMRVAVAWSSRAGHAQESVVELAPGATVADALGAAGIVPNAPGVASTPPKTGIWGKVCPLDTVVRPGDRVEVYRPLQIEPMEARRLRQRRQRELTCSRPR